jgi:hypothetical protein
MSSAEGLAELASRDMQPNLIRPLIAADHEAWVLPAAGDLHPHRVRALVAAVPQCAGMSPEAGLNRNVATASVERTGVESNCSDDASWLNREAHAVSSSIHVLN